MTYLQRYFATERTVVKRSALAGLVTGTLCQNLTYALGATKAWGMLTKAYLAKTNNCSSKWQSMTLSYQNSIQKILKKGTVTEVDCTLKASSDAHMTKKHKTDIKMTNSANHYYGAVLARRSHYDITNKLPLPKSEVTELIKKVVRQCPSSFNVQSSRIVILYGAEHQRVWDIVKAALKKVTSEDQYAASAQKVDNCFAAGAGTVLYFEDQDAVKQQQEQFPAYAANFPIWSQQHSAIVQFTVWTALAQEKIGATLQHYNELIESDLRTAFDLSQSWKLIAQMPFGSFQNPAPEKTYIPDEKRFIVRGE